MAFIPCEDCRCPLRVKPDFKGTVISHSALTHLVQLVPGILLWSINKSSMLLKQSVKGQWSKSISRGSIIEALGHWVLASHRHLALLDSQSFLLGCDFFLCHWLKWLTKGARGASKVPRESTTLECFTEVWVSFKKMVQKTELGH